MSDDGPSNASVRTNGNPNYQVWRDIRERSVADFVNTVSRRFDAPLNRKLRAELYEVVFNNGLAVTRWNGVNYTGPMLLDMYRRAQQELR